MTGHSTVVLADPSCLASAHSCTAITPCDLFVFIYQRIKQRWQVVRSSMMLGISCSQCMAECEQAETPYDSFTMLMV